MKNEFIEQAINKLVKQGYINFSFQYLDIVELAKKLGFMVISFKDRKHKSFIVLNRKKPIAEGYKQFLFINENLSAKEKRFLIAYELGHYMLEYGSENRYCHSTFLFKTNPSVNQKDKNANFFACCLLMPEHIFKADYESLLRDNEIEDIIVLLSEKYRVPENLICKRILQLEIK